MCDPMSIAGLALTAGSTFANMQQANAVDKARAKAMRAERERQGLLDEEAYGLNEDSRQEYEDFEGKRQGQAQNLEDMFARNSGDAASTGLAPSDNNVVNQAIGKAKASADTRQSQQSSALANLRAYGNTFGNAGREQAKDAQLIGQIGGFKQGSQAVLPLELEAANSAGSGWGLLADFAGGIGGLGLNAGLSGGGSPFGATASPLSAPIPKRKPISAIDLY
ncbi:hypothetical protein IWQ55_000309 [Labrenzia sp. EL_208]|nr:hypothetical protein [Labrenzia sp. EL_132]MBG6227117.1 hypothetical protein [Labrenzia sp. EL_208]